MYYKRIAVSNGPYVDGMGQQYDVCCVRRVRSAQQDNQAYEKYESLAVALEAWQLCKTEQAEDRDSNL